MMKIWGVAKASADTQNAKYQLRQIPCPEPKDGQVLVKTLDEIGFTGWATAEVGGGVERLTEVCRQMQAAFGL